MIRIFRAESGESFNVARERAPSLSAPDPAALRVQLVSGDVFDVPELTAIDRALAELDGGDADVVVAPGGSIYRIFRAERAPAITPPPVQEARPSDPAGCMARDRSTRVLVAAREPLLVRLSHLIDFLGYQTRVVFLKGDDGESAFESALAEHDPHLVIVGPSDEDDVVAASAKARGCGVVVVGHSRPSDGVDAAIRLPISSDKLAPLLDSIVDRMRTARQR